MNEIHFDEDQLKDLHSLAVTLFDQDASDPRSWNYKRTLVRPKIHWMRIILFILLIAAGALGLYWLLVVLSVPSVFAVWGCVLGVAVTLLLFLKRILICLVQIYQALAPASIRNKCRFEPSCSHYMILALQKYGVRKGFSKGIDRLKRCNTDGGGYDDP